MDKCCVYELTFSNGKRYVGVTWNLKERLRGHRKGNSLVANAFRKHGNPSAKCLLIGERDYCYKMENLLVEQRETLHPQGYNLLTGGKGGTKHNNVTRTKMANSRRGAKHTEETKKKLSVRASKENLSPETRWLKSDANRRRIVSGFTRERMRVSGLARWARERQKNG